MAEIEKTDSLNDARIKLNTYIDNIDNFLTNYYVDGERKLSGDLDFNFFSALNLKSAMGVVNIKAFGAKGDGVTNDSAAFRAAASYIESKGGGHLFIPPGTYIVGEQVHEEGVYPYYQDQEIFHVTGINGLIIEGQNATLKIADGMHYGSFDPDTGERYDPPEGGFTDPNYEAAIGNVITIEDCKDVIIKNITIDGGIRNAIIGGYWGDGGIQLRASGISIIGESSRVCLINVKSSYCGLDGFYIGTTGSQISMLNCLSSYNGRQGLSITGGFNIEIRDCKFINTGRAINVGEGSEFHSSPGAGVDIEPSSAQLAENITFINCVFDNNVGCGMVMDSGQEYVSRITVVGSLFRGQTTWSLWAKQKDLVVVNSRIEGSAVHTHNTFINCEFYNDATLFGDLCLEDSDDAPLYIQNCKFYADGKRLFWITGAMGSNYMILRDCTFTLNGNELTSQLCAFVGGQAILSNCKFHKTGADPDDAYYISCDSTARFIDCVSDSEKLRFYNSSGPTEVRYLTAQANSTATDVAGLRADFNALLQKLRDGKLMAT